MKLRGKIIEIHETKRTSKSKVRNFVLMCEIETKTAGLFQNEYLFTLTADRVTDLNRYHVGDTVEVDFNLGSSKYTDRETGIVTRYNLLLCRNITRISARQDGYSPIGVNKLDIKTGLL